VAVNKVEPSILSRQSSVSVYLRLEAFVCQNDSSSVYDVSLYFSLKINLIRFSLSLWSLSAVISPFLVISPSLITLCLFQFY